MSTGSVAARGIRHVVVAPLFCVLVLVAVVLSPALLAITAVWSLLLDRSGRPLRGMLFLLVYGVHDVMALLAGFAIWLRLAGGGPMHGEAMQARHYRLMGWLLRRLVLAAESILDLHLIVDGEPAAEAVIAAAAEPLVVLSRHAGPGDSFLLVHELLRRGRYPRIVLRSALQLDPGIDLLGNRLPFCFVTAGNPVRNLHRLGEVAAGLGGRDLLLLFPEGGNATAERRRARIAGLLRTGKRRAARRAARLEHVVAPRAAGAAVALEESAHAGVVFVAHSGLAGMHRAPWKRVPVHRTLRIHLWHVPRSEVPDGGPAQAEWLFRWWRRIDEWIEATPGAS